MKYLTPSGGFLFILLLLGWPIDRAVAQTAPVISNQPASVTLLLGRASTFSVTATGPGLRFLWYRNGTLFFTSPVFTVSPATSTISETVGAQVASYKVRVIDNVGRFSETQSWSVTPSPFLVSISASPVLPSTVNVGSAIRFSATVTASSSSTGPYRYQWLRGGTSLTGATATTLALSAVTPADAGVYRCDVTDARSVKVSSSGLAMQVSSGAGSLRIVNTSTRLFVGTGDQVLITGLVLDGSGARSLLVRAVGPGLSPFGVTGVLSDPQLSVYLGGTVLASNNDWTAALGPIMSQVGAFALPAASRDSALVVSLPAGAYTFMVSAANNTSGIALQEVYELP